MTGPAPPPAPPLPALRDALEDAVRAAGAAVGAFLDAGRVRVAVKFGARGPEPLSEADRAADEVLRARLPPLLPGAHWLSEESAQDEPIVPGEPAWVVDPLDGTREFLLGLPEFGVSAALFLGDRLALGAVALPPRGRGGDWSVLSGLPRGPRPEARRDGVPLPPLADGGAIGRVAVSRHDYERRRLQLRVPFEVYPAGSSVLKLAQVAAGEAGAYLSTGPRSVWDAAGGAAVLEAAGGALLGAGGRPLRLTPQQVRIPPFAAAAPARARAVLRAVGAGA